MNAEDPLFILYTSGSTGKPEGRAAHHRRLSRLHLDDASIRVRLSRRRHLLVHRRCRLGHRPQLHRLWPAANGAITLMFEGVPNYPTNSRFWEVIDKHKVNIFYTAPTAIRALMQAGDEPVKKTSRASLRLLGSVGEPINPEAWEWYYRVVGDDRCPIVDTWWQTETGGILITPLPGAIALKPGSATLPFFGVQAGNRRRRRQGARRRHHRQSLHRRFVAGPDAHGLWRSSALRRHLFQHLSRQVFHRRRLPPRRGRLLLDHRPRRRRDQRLRPPHGHGGSGIARWSRIRRCRRPPWSAIRTTSRARASMPMSP